MSLRFTQVAIEALQRPSNPTQRVSQLAVEVLRRPSAANLRFSQIAVEVISHNGGLVTASAGGMLIIAT